MHTKCHGGQLNHEQTHHHQLRQRSQVEVFNFSYFFGALAIAIAPAAAQHNLFKGVRVGGWLSHLISVRAGVCACVSVSVSVRSRERANLERACRACEPNNFARLTGAIPQRSPCVRSWPAARWPQVRQVVVVVVVGQVRGAAGWWGRRVQCVSGACVCVCVSVSHLWCKIN